MSKGLRRTIFYSFSVLFLAAGGLILAYSNGMAFNLETLTFQKTGALLIKSFPPGAVIKINGQPHHKDRFGFLINGTLIKNLAPGLYQVIVEQPEYRLWEKQLEIKPGLVTSASRIILAPATTSPKVSVEEAKDFWLLAGRIFWQDRQDQIYFSDGNSRNQIARGNLAGNLNEESVIAADKTGDYYLINLKNPQNAVNLNEIFLSLKEGQLNLPGRVPVTVVLPHPFNNQRVILSSTQAVYTLDIKRFNLEILAESPSQALTHIGSELFWFDPKVGSLKIINLLTRTTEALKLEVTTGAQIKRIKTAPARTKVGLLTETGELYLFDRLKKKTEKIADGVRDFDFSADNKKLALIENERLLFVALEDFSQDVKRTAGTSVVLQIPGVKSQIEWFKDASHLLVLSHGDLILTEIDERPPLNWTVLEKSVKKFMIEGSNAAYILKNDGRLLKLTI